MKRDVLRASLLGVNAFRDSKAADEQLSRDTSYAPPVELALCEVEEHLGRMRRRHESVVMAIFTSERSSGW